MYHEDIFCPFLPMFSTFDGKMVNVVENAECFTSTHYTLYTVLGWAVSPLKGVWQPGAALLQASHSGTQLAPGQGFRYSGSGIQASEGEKLCLQLGNISWMLPRTVSGVWSVGVCAGLPGVARSLVRSCAALSAWSRLQHSALAANSRYTVHTDTHRLDTTLYTLDTAHFTH